eukprot:4100525-Prymnesium_polylepis.1
MSERQRAREVHAFALCDVVGLCGLLCDGVCDAWRRERRTAAVIAPDPGKSSKNATVADHHRPNRFRTRGTAAAGHSGQAAKPTRRPRMVGPTS